MPLAACSFSFSETDREDNVLRMYGIADPDPVDHVVQDDKFMVRVDNLIETCGEQKRAQQPIASAH